MLNLDKLSTEAKIGKILILIDIILGAVSMVYSLLFFSAMSSPLGFGLAGFGLFASFFFVYIILKIIGIVIGIFALKTSGDGDFHKAGILAGISSLLPPISIVMIIGALLCFLSPEGKKAAPKPQPNQQVMSPPMSTS